MNRYLKLVNFELSRFSRLYYTLIALIVVVQLIPFLYFVNRYKKEVTNHMNLGETNERILQVLDGKYSLLQVIESFSFNFSLMLGIAVLGIYVFFIWYRDWFLKNAFVYRLLTLPTSRLNVFLAKLTTIVLLVLGLVVLQYGLLYFENAMIQVLVPLDFRSDLNVYQAIESSHLEILLPSSLLQFFLNYGVGIVTVCVIFTAILFERSFKKIGIVYGVLYVGVALLLFIMPMIIQLANERILLYTNELNISMILIGIVIGAGSMLLSRYLLRYKITV